MHGKISLPKIGIIRLGTKNQGRPIESPHFVFEINDNFILDKTRKLFAGEPPTSLDIRFFSNQIDDVYRCRYQRWAKSGNGKGRLLCEGDGKIAYEDGKRKNCPCPQIGKLCRKTAILKFIIPSISIFGYFRMVTKSQHSISDIETSLRLTKEKTGRLTGHTFRLLRTEGFANINGIKMKKYYVALLNDSPLPSLKNPDSSLKKLASNTFVDSYFPSPEYVNYLERQKEKRLRKGRQMVKARIRLYITTPFAEKAIEEYAKQRFSKESFDLLDIEDLLQLYHEIEDNTEVISKVFEISQKMEKSSKAYNIFQVPNI